MNKVSNSLWDKDFGTTFGLENYKKDKEKEKFRKL